MFLLKRIPTFLDAKERAEFTKILKIRILRLNKILSLLLIFLLGFCFGGTFLKLYQIVLLPENRIWQLTLGISISAPISRRQKPPLQVLCLSSPLGLLGLCSSCLIHWNPWPRYSIAPVTGPPSSRHQVYWISHRYPCHWTREMLPNRGESPFSLSPLSFSLVPPLLVLLLLLVARWVHMYPASPSTLSTFSCFCSSRSVHVELHCAGGCWWLCTGRSVVVPVKQR